MMTIHAVAEKVESKLYYWGKHAFTSRESSHFAAVQHPVSVPKPMTWAVFYAQKSETPLATRDE
jgi:hypothetical protein